MTKIETVVSFLSLWVARFALALLASAGMLHLLGGVDPIIAYPITIIGVAFLVKETHA